MTWALRQIEVVDDAEDVLLVARDDSGTQDDGVALIDMDVYRYPPRPG